MKIKSRTKYTIIFFITASILVFLLLFPYNILENRGLGNYRIVLTEHDRIGEFVGGVLGVLLSTLAVVLVFLTYKSQRREYQDAERRAVIESNEERIFRLMSMLDSISNSLSKKYNSEDFFRDRLNEFRNLYEVDMIPGLFIPLEIHRTVVDKFKKFYFRYINGFGSWFRMLNQIIYYIDRVDVNEKQFYYGVLTSSLSEPQIIFFYYYIHAYYSNEDKNRIKSFCILENLQGYLLPEFSNVISFDLRMEDSLVRSSSETNTLVHRSSLASTQDNLCRLIKLIRKYPNTTHNHSVDTDINLSVMREGYGFTIQITLDDVDKHLVKLGFDATLHIIGQKTIFNLLQMAVIHTICLRVDANTMDCTDFSLHQSILSVTKKTTLTLSVQPSDRDDVRLLYGISAG